MTNPTSNVLPFPIRLVRAALTPPLTTFDPGGSLPPVTGNTKTLTADEHGEYVASIVRAAIRFGRRKGLSLSSLPPQLRIWLTDLSDEGDPTCLVVLDWLTGNRRHLPHAFDSDGAEVLPKKSDGVGTGEGA